MPALLSSRRAQGFPTPGGRSEGRSCLWKFAGRYAWRTPDRRPHLLLYANLQDQSSACWGLRTRRVARRSAGGTSSRRTRLPRPTTPRSSEAPTILVAGETLPGSFCFMPAHSLACIPETHRLLSKRPRLNRLQKRCQRLITIGGNYVADFSRAVRNSPISTDCVGEGQSPMQESSSRLS